MQAADAAVVAATGAKVDIKEEADEVDEVDEEEVDGGSASRTPFGRD